MDALVFQITFIAAYLSHSLALSSFLIAFHQDPFKSSIVFASTFLIWVLLICVPSRYLILAIGMSQFVAGFFARRQGSKKRRKKSGAKNKANKASGTMHRHVGDKPRPPFIVVWLRNFIRTLPTNEDLRKTYFWQSRLASARFMEEHAFAKRTSRLQKLWQATWYGQARLRENSLANAAMKTGAVSPASDMAWLDVFVVLQGHRLLWWSDARSFDVGDTPVGSLFLAGHSGLTNPSPLELRRIPKEDLDRIVCIFGKGEKEQIRITILASDAEEKDVLENAVLEISLKND